MGRVVVLGVFVADTAYRADRQPRMGETIMGRSFALGPGGKGSNQAVAAARAGAETHMITRLARDPFGDMALATWATAGVIPAVTHVDYSARVQTVDGETNPRYASLIKAFQRKTGCPSVVNTSFNVRGEPIVCTPQDAYRCFMRTEMDVLVLENQLLFKQEQPQEEQDERWMQEFELD